MFIRVERGIVRLLGRGEQRHGGLALAQRHLQILVGLHHLPHRLVARMLELLLGDALLRARGGDAIAA